MKKFWVNHQLLKNFSIQETGELLMSRLKVVGINRENLMFRKISLWPGKIIYSCYGNSSYRESVVIHVIWVSAEVTTQF